MSDFSEMETMLMAQSTARLLDIHRLQAENERLQIEVAGMRAELVTARCITRSAYAQTDEIERLRAALAEAKGHMKCAEGLRVPYSAAMHFRSAYEVLLKALAPEPEAGP